MSRITGQQVINILALICALVMNSLANSLPLNGQTTGEISDRFPILFVPDGYVFSIWGLIYIALIAFVIYQALPAQRDNPRLQAIFCWFVVSNLANILWLFFWHFEFFPLSLLAMTVILVSLLMIYYILRVNKPKISKTERWLVNAPFSLYLGWISVATIANVSQVLYISGWSGWGFNAIAWTIIMLVVAAGLALLMFTIEDDYIYGLVIIWAVIGIAVKQAYVPVIANTSWVLVGLIILGSILIQTILKKKVVSL